MTEGPKKPEFVPPTLGDDLERHGMAFDFEGTKPNANRQQQERQKNKQNRNNNNRRDHNRSHKEKRMDETTTANGPQNNRHHMTHGGDNKDLAALIDVFERSQSKILEGIKEAMTDGNKEIGSTLANELVKINGSVAAFNTEARELVKTTEAIPQKMNEVRNWDNLKGDLRTAGVIALVNGAIAGAFWLITYLASDEAEMDNTTTTTPTLNGSNPTTRRATT